MQVDFTGFLSDSAPLVQNELDSSLEVFRSAIRKYVNRSAIHSPMNVSPKQHQMHCEIDVMEYMEEQMNEIIKDEWARMISFNKAMR